MSTQKASSEPPVLDGTNYPLWKSRMIPYISAQDDYAWEAVERGWNPPVVQTLSPLGEIVSILQPKENWTELERKLSMGNSKALNAIFGAVDQEQFEYIWRFNSAKEAWDKLEHVYLTEQFEHEFSDSSDLLLARVHQKIRSLSKRSDHQFIFRFLLTQRKENEEAYEPEMLSIGPYHHGKSKYQKMEMYKLEYLQGILERHGEKNANTQQQGPHMKEESSTCEGMLERLEEMNVEKYTEALIQAVKKARNCYSRDANLYQLIDFDEMMLLDGCFIIEFLRNYSKDEEEWKKDPVFKMKWLVEICCRDMLLFENQLPFFILDDLFEMTKIEGSGQNLIQLAKSCLNHCISADNVSDSSDIINRPANTISHLLGLMYDIWCSSFVKAEHEHSSSVAEDYVQPERKDSCLNHHILDFSAFTLQKLKSNGSQEVNVGDLQFIKSVSELEEYGIKFSNATCKESKSWLDIKFEDRTIKIPTLVVQDHTESLLRNLIAYEEYGIDEGYKGKVVSDYTTLMNCLVNSSRDVQMLRHEKIIQNFLGNDELLSDIFNRIRPNVSLNCPWFSYRKIFKEVNEHCSKRRNRWIADLKKKYFNNPWSITAFLAATVLLVLTLLLTIFSIG